MDSRHHLVVDSRVRLANGYGERGCPADGGHSDRRAPRNLGFDKVYDTKGFAAFMGWWGVTPHVARNNNRKGGSAIEQRAAGAIAVTDKL